MRRQESKVSTAHNLVMSSDHSRCMTEQDLGHLPADHHHRRHSLKRLPSSTSLLSYRNESAPSYGDPTAAAVMFFGMGMIILGLTQCNLIPDMAGSNLSLFIISAGFGLILFGILFFCMKETFKMILFCSYGCYWLTQGFYFLIARLGWSPTPDSISLAIFYTTWTMFTFVLIISGGITETCAPIVTQLILLDFSHLFCCLHYFLVYDAGPKVTWLKVVGGVAQVGGGAAALYYVFVVVISEALAQKKGQQNVEDNDKPKHLLPLFVIGKSHRRR